MRPGGGTTDHRPVVEVETAFVPGALDASVDDGSLVKRGTTVGAAVAESTDATPLAQQEDRRVGHPHRVGLAVAQVALGAGVGPLGGRPLEGGRVDAYAERVGEVATEPPRDTDDPEPGQREDPPAASLPADHP